MEGIRMDAAVLSRMKTEQGPTLGELTDGKTVLLVFLRNFGCTFCRQALKDISAIRGEIEEAGVTIVFVHLSSEDIALPFFQKRGLADCFRISDPDSAYYQDFGLTKGTFRQLFGLQNWIKGFQASTLEGHGVTLPIGDGFQMPGVFILEDQEIKVRYVHKVAADRPDYLELINQVSSSPDMVES